MESHRHAKSGLWFSKCNATERGEAVDFYARLGSVPVLRKIGPDMWSMHWERKDLVGGMRKTIRGNREYFVQED